MKNQKGFSLIELLIVVVIIGIIAAIAIPNLLASRRAANESAAIASLRTITGAQATYQATVGGGSNFADNAGLNTAGLVDAVLGCAATPCVKSGYGFTITDVDQDTTNGTAASYDALASAVQLGSGLTGTGSRHFGTNESGTIWQDTTAVVAFDATTRQPAATSVPVP